MELFERRKYYFCRYCGTFHFIETEAAGGIQVLGRSGEAAPCPACASPLTTALLDEAYPVQYCEKCRGVLVPRGVFVDVTTTRRAFASGAPTPPRPLDERELRRRLICPTCQLEMDVHPYYGPGSVVIDTCSRCDSIWLDCGELKQIVDAPGRDRGRRFAPPDDPAGSAAGAPSGRQSKRIRIEGDSLLDILADLFN